MLKLSEMSMSKKIYFVVALLTVVAITIAVIGNRYLSSMNNRLDSIVNTSSEKVKLGEQISKYLFEVSLAEKNILLASTIEEMQEFQSRSQSVREEMRVSRDKLRELVDEEGKAILDEFTSLWDQYLEVHDEVVRLGMLNSNVRARELSQGEARLAYEQAEANLLEIVDSNESQISRLNDVRLLKVKAKKGSLATKISKNLVEMQRGEKNLILAKSQEEMDEYARAIETYEEDMLGQLEELKQMADAGMEVNQIEAFEKNYDRYMQLSKQVRDYSRENGNTRAFDLASGTGKQLLTQAEQRMGAIVVANIDQMETDKAISDANYAQANRLMIGISFFGILGAVGLSILIMSGLNKKMNKFIKWLSEGAEQTSSASSQVSASSQSLAEGASEQAASVEETSASLEEMSSMTPQNSESAKEANALATETKQSAEDGNSRMEQMLAAIKEVDTSSEETSKIIKTIDEIAFQTNLLALNAAVEAARAGEAGQGFAVVADEVRNLAQRAAEAAKNTSELIEESRESTKKSVTIVEDVAEALKDITERARKMDSLVGEIAASSVEQEQGIDQINTAMTQIDDVTQTIAGNAEESASASEELSAQAETLMSTVQEMMILIEGQKGEGQLSAGWLSKNNSGNKNSEKHDRHTLENSNTEQHANGSHKNGWSNGNRKLKQEEAEKAIPLEESDLF